MTAPSNFPRPMGAVPLRDQTCPRHEGPRSYCGCGLPLDGEGVLREQRAADAKVLAENPRNVAVTVCSGEEVRMAGRLPAGRAGSARLMGRPDLMAKLETLVDVNASLRAGHLVARENVQATVTIPEFCRCGDALEHGRCTNEHCRHFVRPESVRASDAVREATTPIAWAIVREDGSMCDDIERSQATAERYAVEYASRHRDGRAPYTVVPLVRLDVAAEPRVIAENAAHYDLLVVAAGAEINIVLQMARDLEANGDTPSLVWQRDADGEIAAVKLVGHLSRETVKEMGR